MLKTNTKVFIAGISSLILTMGIARFAYTPLLQVMQDAHVLNDAIGGWLATFNYMGYLTGTLIAASISDLKLKDTLYRLSLLIAVITTIAMAWTENWIVWAILRYLSGLTSAGGLLLGSGLILNWLIRHGYKMNMGVHFGGVGLGIAVSALAVELMLPGFNWIEQWEMFALLGFILVLPAWFWLPRPDGHNITKTGEQLIDKPPSKQWLRFLSYSYFCVGIGYVVYATFLVVIANNQPALQGYGNWAWLLVGITTIPSCVMWDKIAERRGEINALLMAYVLMTISIFILAFNVPLYMLVISALIYGGSMMGIVSMMLSLVGKLYPTKPAKPMGRISVFYAIAQIIAPVISGYIAEATGRYSIALALATAIMLIGIILLIVLKRMPEQEK
ncbi:MAG: YbfB/YjiJ family MFS transporter [Proteobacteria bacterium]|nr:YbfB/YjiJ family MFS transporter [Pseudomonadota bacterium]NOG59152.1 YbfB/YjiJ family MFS transporter [Pseudomonadota bacterium]